MAGLVRAFRNAFRGLGWLARSQRNARIHLALTLAVTALGLWLGLSALEWAVLALTIGVVLAGEAFNTALEAIVDLVSPQWHVLARTAKDVAAAGVLLLALAASVVGVAIFAGRFLARLGP